MHFTVRKYDVKINLLNKMGVLFAIEYRIDWYPLLEWGSYMSSNTVLTDINYWNGGLICHRIQYWLILFTGMGVLYVIELTNIIYWNGVLYAIEYIIDGYELRNKGSYMSSNIVLTDIIN